MRYVIIAAGLLWGFAALPEVTDAAIGFGWWILLFFGGCLTGLLWVIYSLAMPDVFHAPRVRWLWWLVPLIGVGGLVLAVTHRDLAVRVWLCDSELRQYAEGVQQNPNAPLEFNRRVGLFVVRYASADENQVMFYTASGFLDSAGIVYRPDGAPPEYCKRYEHLYGPWWWFWEKF